MAGPDRPVMTDSKCGMHELRRQQRILCGAAARLLKAASEVLRVFSPSPHDLQETIDLLESKGAAMYEIGQKIVDLLGHGEVDPEYFEALAYRGGVCRALNRLCNAFKVPKASRPA